MCAIRSLTITIALTSMIATSGAAQTTITIDNPDAPRASIRAGYGGHGVDWAASIDSPQLAELVRFRADVGYGRWVGLGETGPPAGLNPPVTRVAASVLLRIVMRESLPNLRPYWGVGIARYTPHHVDMDAQRGVRLIFGLDGIGDRWTIGQEVEVEIPRTKDVPSTGQDLVPTVRIGIAVRRHF